MSRYETVILISNKITEQERNNAVERLTNLILENGTITKQENLGEKRLAYEVRKHEKAFYYVIEFESDSSFIVELERNYRIMDEVIKFITIRKD